MEKGRLNRKQRQRLTIQALVLALALAGCLLASGFIFDASAGSPAGPVRSGMAQSDVATDTPEPTWTPYVYPSSTPTRRPPPTATRQFTNTPKPFPTATATPVRTAGPPTLPPSPTASPLPKAAVSSPTGPVPRSSIVAPVPTAIPSLTLTPSRTLPPPTRTPTVTATPSPTPRDTLTPSATAPPPVFVAAPRTTATRARPTATPVPASGGSPRVLLALGGAAVGLGGLIGILALLIARSRLRDS